MSYCLTGCATDLKTGQKSCPVQDQILVDHTIQACNPQYSCTDPRTPYALLSDGNINIQGICEEGVMCPCVSSLRCSEYTASVFAVTNGNSFEDVSDQRIVFKQSSNVSDADPNLVYCQIPPQWILRSNPGCNFLSSITLTSIVNECIPNNPCLSGVLTLVPQQTLDVITEDDLQRSNLSCIKSLGCDKGQLPVWDRDKNQVVCYTNNNNEWIQS